MVSTQKKVAVLVLRFKDDASKKIKGLNGALKKLTSVAVQPLTIAIAALGAGFVAMANRGSKFREVSMAFRAMTGTMGVDADELLNKMKKATAGTVSELELMQQANQALMLGLPVERFDEILTIARSASKATGQSMQFMLNSIVTGLGRGSKLMLDNLGIVFNLEDAYKEYARTIDKTASSLNDAEKKQAFLNIALKKGMTNVQAQGKPVESAGDAWERLKTTFVDLTDTIASNGSFQRNFRDLFTLVGEGTAALTEFFKGPPENELRQEIKNLERELRGPVTLLGGLKNAANAALRVVSLGFAGGTTEQRLQQKRDEIAAIEQEEKNANQRKKAREIREAEEEKARKAEEERAKVEAINAVRAEANLEQEELRIEALALDQERKEEEIFREAEHLQALKDQENAAKLALIKDDNKRAVAKEKQEQARRTAQLKAQKQLNAALLQGDQQLQQARLGLAAAMGDAIIALMGDNAIAGLALSKAIAVADVFLKASQARMAAWLVALQIQAASFGTIPAQATFAAMEGQLQANTAISLATIAAQTVAGAARLAQGGVVQASGGGTLSLIGEGGSDEAVIPLDDDEAQEKLGGAIGETHIHFHVGAMMGDESEAREFAVMVDEKMLELRRNGESQAFDGSVA